MIAAITPSGAAFMHSALFFTSLTASLNFKASEAQRAVYSPKLCPAKKMGFSPPSSFHIFQTEKAEHNIMG